MFLLAILIGIYSYLILLLGLLGLFSKPIVITTSSFYLFLLFLIFKKSIQFKSLLAFPKNPFFLFLLFLVSLQGVINLLGALGPELAFDALWYHLTLPKLYILKQSFAFIPGGTLYYTAMPQLTEMLYASALIIHSEILAKVIHFLFGVLICISLYKFSRKYFNPNYSLLGVVIFYSNLVVAWESTTAYIDLARTFFEFLALFALINWFEYQKSKWFFLSAILTGLSISTKLLSLGTLGILVILIVIYSFFSKFSVKKISQFLGIFIAIALLIPLPYFLHAYLNTRDVLYSVHMASLGDPTHNLKLNLNPLNFLNDLWSVFTKAADPISPVYTSFLPFLVLSIRKIPKRFIYILLFGLMSLIIWFETPRLGGGRFMVPYLPVLSVICIIFLESLNSKLLKRISISFIIFISLISIAYRGVANIRYIKPVLGLETKEKFLEKYLEFDKGNFADIDGYFKKTITKKDKVLLIGFHNLYYVNFPFIDASWVNPKDKFNYIAVKEPNILPKEYKNFKEIYSNPKTKVKLYSAEK